MSDYRPLKDFCAEKDRILAVFAKKENSDIVIRLIGALAFRTQCTKFGYFQDVLGREFSDIDFASYRKYSGRIIDLLRELGYRENQSVTQLFSDERLLFYDDENNRHVDIFFDRLKFCHTIPLKGRLEIEKLTIPLTELLLEKLQIVRINEKDIIDSIMLLREFPVGKDDDRTIDGKIVAHLCAKNWGWWRTLTGNLSILREFTDKYSQISPKDRQIIHQRICKLKEFIDQKPKSIQWKLRSIIGEKMKWYQDVEEISRS